MEEVICLQTIRETAQREKTLLENLDQHLLEVFPNTDSRETNTPKQPYKVMKILVNECLRYRNCLIKKGISENSLYSLDGNYEVMAEFIAFICNLKDDIPIEFYEPDKVFTKKQFEQRNYICTIQPHERAKILNYTLEEKEKQKLEIKKLNRSYKYPRKKSSIFDYSKDPYEGLDIDAMNHIKNEYAHGRRYHDVPSYEALQEIIIKHNISSNLKPLYLGNSKAACIYRIALHFGDFSIFSLRYSDYIYPRHSFYKYSEDLEAWLKIHGCNIKV